MVKKIRIIKRRLSVYNRRIDKYNKILKYLFLNFKMANKWERKSAFNKWYEYKKNFDKIIFVNDKYRGRYWWYWADKFNIRY